MIIVCVEADLFNFKWMLVPSFVIYNWSTHVQSYSQILGVFNSFRWGGWRNMEVGQLGMVWMFPVTAKRGGVSHLGEWVRVSKLSFSLNIFFWLSWKVLYHIAWAKHYKRFTHFLSGFPEMVCDDEFWSWYRESRYSHRHVRDELSSCFNNVNLCGSWSTFYAK